MISKSENTSLLKLKLQCIFKEICRRSAHLVETINNQQINCPQEGNCEWKKNDDYDGDEKEESPRCRKKVLGFVEENKLRGGREKEEKKGGGGKRRN